MYGLSSIISKLNDSYVMILTFLHVINAKKQQKCNIYENEEL